MPSQTSATPRARRTQADRSAATRDALVAAARRLFAVQGFAEVPTDAIVAAAGVTRGALYHQYRGAPPTYRGAAPACAVQTGPPAFIFDLRIRANTEARS